MSALGFGELARRNLGRMVRCALCPIIFVREVTADHMPGCRRGDINERRAISLDPNCGWARGKADVLYVADAFAVMGKVNELLAAGK